MIASFSSSKKYLGKNESLAKNLINKTKTIYPVKYQKFKIYSNFSIPAGNAFYLDSLSDYLKGKTYFSIYGKEKIFDNDFRDIIYKYSVNKISQDDLNDGIKKINENLKYLDNHPLVKNVSKGICKNTQKLFKLGLI